MIKALLETFKTLRDSLKERAIVTMFALSIVGYCWSIHYLVSKVESEEKKRESSDKKYEDLLIERIEEQERENNLYKQLYFDKTNKSIFIDTNKSKP